MKLTRFIFFVLTALILALPVSAQAQSNESTNESNPAFLEKLLSAGTDQTGGTTCQLGPITFHVPAEYRPACYQTGKPDGEAGLMFWAMLPNLEPITDQNRKEFEASWAKKVLASVRYNMGTLSGQRLLNSYMKDTLPEPNVRQIGQYTVHDLSSGLSLYENAALTPSFFECQTLGSALQKRFGLAYPYCRIIDALNPDIVGQDERGKNKMTIDLTFWVNYDKDVPRIDKLMRDLIATFEQLPQQTK